MVQGIRLFSPSDVGVYVYSRRAGSPDDVHDVAGRTLNRDHVCLCVKMQPPLLVDRANADMTAALNGTDNGRSASETLGLQLGVQRR